MIWRVKGLCIEWILTDMNDWWSEKVNRKLLVKVELSAEVQEWRKSSLMDWIRIENLIVVSDSEWQWVTVSDIITKDEESEIPPKSEWGMNDDSEMRIFQSLNSRTNWKLKVECFQPTPGNIFFQFENAIFFDFDEF